MRFSRRGLLVLFVALGATASADQHVRRAPSMWASEGCPERRLRSNAELRAEAAEGALFACGFAVAGFTLFLGAVWLARLRATRGGWQRVESGRAPAVDAGGIYREAGTVPLFHRGPPASVLLASGAVFLTLGPMVVRGVVLLLAATTVSMPLMLLALLGLATTLMASRGAIDGVEALLAGAAEAPRLAARAGRRMVLTQLAHGVLAMLLGSSLRLANAFERCIWLGVAMTSVAAVIAGLLVLRAARLSADHLSPEQH